MATIQLTEKPDELPMQGPNALLNVITIPPGATYTQPRIVIDGTRGAIFEYTSGGPAGALIGSWSDLPGTDPFGNSYPAGMTIGSKSSTQVNMSSVVGQGFLNWLLNDTGISNPSMDGLDIIPGQLAGWTFTGPQNLTAGNNDYISVQIFSGYPSLNDSAQMAILYVDANNAESTLMFITWAGVQLTGSVTGVKPGTGTSATNAAVPENWHSISLSGGPPGVNGYARIKKLAESNFVLLDIEISYTVVTANTLYTIGSLPSAAYYPPTARHCAVGQGGTVTGGANPGRVFVPTSGGIQIEVNTGSSSLGCQAMIALD